MTVASKAAKGAAKSAPDYVIKDIGLADWGRKEIAIAETEMPGLMATREEFGPSSRCAGAHLRLAAHDHPDRGADRDAQGARRRRALGLVQHLLDPGPRGGRGRRRRHAGLRRQGRDARGLLGLSAPDLRVGSTAAPEHDPRRRRRRHAAHPSRARAPSRARPACSTSRPARRRRSCSPPSRSGSRTSPAGTSERRGHPRRDRGDHDRRPPALRDAEEGHAAVPGDQRQRQRHQVEVRQPLRLPRDRWSTASAAAPT